MNVSLTPEVCAALSNSALIELAWTSAAFGADGDAAALLSMAGGRDLPHKLNWDASYLMDISPSLLSRAFRQMGMAWGKHLLEGRDGSSCGDLISRGPWSRGTPVELVQGFIESAGRESITGSFRSFVDGANGFWAYMPSSLSLGFHFFPEWDAIAVDALLARSVDESPLDSSSSSWKQPWALGIVDVDDLALASRLFAALVARGGDLAAALSAPSLRDDQDNEEIGDLLGALAKAIYKKNQPMAELMVDMCPSIDVEKAIATIKKTIDLRIGTSDKSFIRDIIAESDGILALGESLLLRSLTPAPAAAGAGSLPRLRL